jgi:hypothetical protein
MDLSKDELNEFYSTNYVENDNAKYDKQDSPILL